MKEQLLWTPHDPTTLLAVDSNAQLTRRRDKITGFTGAVIFPRCNVALSEAGVFETGFHYNMDNIPEVGLFYQLEHPLESYVTKKPHRTIAPSIRALLTLANDWTRTKHFEKRELESETGRYKSIEIAEWSKKDNLRVRWLIAWLWPNLNSHKVNGKYLSNEKRSEILNDSFQRLGWSERITRGTLKTTANRMGLGFPD